MIIAVPNRFPQFKDIELYSPHLVDTVYTVEKAEIKPRYLLDFGDDSIDEEIFNRRNPYGNNEFDWLEFSQNEIDSNQYISLLAVFNETENIIHLRFGTPETNFNAFFDKRDGSIRIGRELLQNDIDYGFVPFVYQSSDDALVSVIESAALIHHVNQIKESDPTKYEDPRMENIITLADTLEEYGNPVLKIAKFKE